MTERAWPQAILENRRVAWLLAVLAAILFAMGNLPWQLDDYDQAKQAFTSFQMVNEGRWLYQTTPHDKVATKPPLAGWTSALLFVVTRSWEFAWRAPSLAAAAAIGFLLFRFSRTAHGFIPAVIAFCAFAFNLITPRLATLVRTDMPLALVIFAIGTLTWVKLRNNESWKPNDQWLIFTLLTAGMLIKGPVVWAFLLPGIIAFQFWRGREGVAAFSGVWPWIGSLIIFLIWVAGGILVVPGFYEQVVTREFLGRFGGEVHRAQPLFFYLPHLLHKFAPWSLAIVALALMHLGRRDWKWRSLTMSREMAWLLCWSLGGLIVMSLLPSKRVDRIFPVIPPLCLLLSAQVAHGLSVPSIRQRLYRWTAAAMFLAFLFAGGYAVSKSINGYREHRDALARFGAEVRKRAVADNLRYVVVSSPDEGLLLYLRKTAFVLPQRASDNWNSGNIDALVVSTVDVIDLAPRLNPPGIVTLQSGHRKQRDTRDYVFVTKPSP